MNALETTVRKIKAWTGLHSASSLVTTTRPAYHFLLNTLYGRRGLVRVINGDLRVYVRPIHRYADEDYEPSVYTHLKSLVKPGAVVLDVGAHVGLFTILLAHLVTSKGRVFAFEPTPATHAALSDHLKLNNVADRVEVVREAISDAVGEAPFHTVQYSPENTLNTVHSRLGSSEQVLVPVTTIDAFCEARKIKPTLIKIDIEGYEWHALRGAKETLSRYRPDVLVEVHPMNWAEIGESLESAFRTLKFLGYSAIPLEGQTDPLNEYGHVMLVPAS
jgi:FkbM family methyltransferase